MDDPDQIASHLARNLAALRHVRGQTQDALAKAASVPRSTIANLESGEGNPSLAVLVKVASALGVPIDELLASPRARVRKWSTTDIATQHPGGGVTGVPGHNAAREILRDFRRKRVAPTLAAFQAAAANADWVNAPGYYLILSNQPGDASWPMTAATFILMYAQPGDKAASAEAIKFFDWAFKNGDKAAEELDYIPMPANVKDMVRKTWAGEIKS